MQNLTPINILRHSRLLSQLVNTTSRNIIDWFQTFFIVHTNIIT